MRLLAALLAAAASAAAAPLVLYWDQTLGGPCPASEWAAVDEGASLADLDAARLAQLGYVLDWYVVNDLAAQGSAGLAVDWRGERAYETYWGSVDSGAVPVPAGAVSGLFTAVLAYQLRDQGTWSLDALVTDFYPELTAFADVNILCLLSHAAGLPSGALPASADELVSTLADVEPLFAPWETSAQSALGVALAGQLAAEAAGLSFAEALDEFVVGPLGLRNTTTSDAWDAPALGVTASLDDLLALLAAVGGERASALLPATGRELSMLGHLFPDGSFSARDGGSFGLVLHGRRALVTAGDAAAVARVPSLDLAVAVAGAGASTYALSALEVVVPALEQLLAPLAPLPAAPADPAPFVGTWEYAAGVDIVVWPLGNGVLAADIVGDVYMLDYRGNDTFGVLTQATLPATPCQGMWELGEDQTALVFNTTASPPVVHWPQMMEYLTFSLSSG